MKNEHEKRWIQGLKRKEDKLLFSKILDQYHNFQKTGSASSSEFLNMIEKVWIEKGLEYLRIPYHTYCPNDVCERFVIYFGKFQNFVSFYQIPNISVRHSDVLGTLFVCGFTYSMIGDIFILENQALLTNLTKYNTVLEESFTMIGIRKIQLRKIDELPYIPKKFQDLYWTVSSTRVDLVVAKILGKSRKNANEYMKEKQVLINYQPAFKNVSLKQNDILSIQNSGKYKICQITPMKNGKFRLLIQKYC